MQKYNLVKLLHVLTTKKSEKEREQILNHDYDWQELEEVSSK